MYLLKRSLIGMVVGLFAALFLIALLSFAADDQVTLASLGGPIWVTIAALLIGGSYALLFEPRPRNAAENGATGLLLGIILWFVWAISLHPVLLGQGPQWNAASTAVSIPKLIAYLLQGGFVGLVYGFAFQQLAQPLTLLAPSVTRQPIPITQRILIIGGGYAGVAAAQTLEKELADSPHVAITLVSQTNFLIHTPMLSEVSSNAVNAQNISPALRSFFKQVQVIQGDVVNIDLNGRYVLLDADARTQQKQLPFDHLILTVGGVPNFFGNADVEREAFTFKTLDDAIVLRNQILDMFERADLEPNSQKRRQMLTFVVAGGGFAGVELLGGVNDFTRGITAYYPNINPQDVRTVLVHSRDTILPELSRELGQFAREKLAERGVEFQLSKRVTGARPGVVVVSDGEIPSHTFVWTAGNRPSPIMGMLGLPLTKRGQLEVNTELHSPNAPFVWAAGDCAQIPDLTTDGFCPPTAQHALREGKQIGYNVAAALKGQPLKPFKFKMFGSLAALGHQLAVAELFGYRFSGFLAWLMWRGIYLSKLPTFQKQVRVLLDWVLDIFLPPDLAQTVSFSRSSAAEVRQQQEKAEVLS